MSLRDAVAHDGRGAVASVAHGMSGVDDIYYQEDPMANLNLHGCIRRKAEVVTVVMEPDALAVESSEVVSAVEEESDWELNNTFAVGEQAVMQFSRRWW